MGGDVDKAEGEGEALDAASDAAMLEGECDWALDLVFGTASDPNEPGRRLSFLGSVVGGFFFGGCRVVQDS